MDLSDRDLYPKERFCFIKVDLHKDTIKDVENNITNHVKNLWTRWEKENPDLVEYYKEN